ncbi:MAG: protein kinase [Cyclobacteriaceae bacterium]|nr:serine/threonine-protein kinase [Cyclobacteriaceae bacterium]MCH8515882.1 protein kinase [Cyclobacteriaceae bacterium]
MINIKRFLSGSKNTAKAKLYPKQVIIPKSQFGEYIESMSQFIQHDQENIIQFIKVDVNGFKESSYTCCEWMEYCESGTLIEQLKKAKTQDKLINLLWQFLNGIQSLHEMGYIHRDIKLTNALVTTKDGAEVVKVSDFVLLPHHDYEVMTTPEFLAPEVMQDSDYSVQSDIWSLGVSFYELFSAEYPFGNRLDGYTPRDIKKNTLELVPSGFNKLPQLMQKIVKQCLNKDPAQRPGSVLQIMDVFKKV